MAKRRLIDANLLRRLCAEVAAHEWNKKSSPVSWSDAYEGFIDDIDAMPTVDAVEVVHGRWIPSKSMALSYKCSVCHGWVTRHSVSERKYRYCPNCGAKMDGDGNG